MLGDSASTKEQGASNAEKGPGEGKWVYNLHRLDMSGGKLFATFSQKRVRVVSRKMKGSDSPMIGKKRSVVSSR